MSDEEFEKLVREAGYKPNLEQLGFMRAGFDLGRKYTGRIYANRVEITLDPEPREPSRIARQVKEELERLVSSKKPPKEGA